MPLSPSALSTTLPATLRVSAQIPLFTQSTRMDVTLMMTAPAAMSLCADSTGPAAKDVVSTYTFRPFNL